MLLEHSFLWISKHVCVDWGREEPKRKQNNSHFEDNFFIEGTLSHYFRTFGIPAHYLINASSNSLSPRHCDQQQFLHYFQKCPRVLTTSPGREAPGLLSKHLLNTYERVSSTLWMLTKHSPELANLSHILWVLTNIIRS